MNHDIFRSRGRLATRVILLALVTVTTAAVATSASAASGGPPKVRENFTPLRCSGKPGSRSTIQQEGCAEHQVLRLDGRINATAVKIWGRLPDAAARRRFAGAQTQWIRFRRADCLSRADEFEGGSQAPVVYAQCLAADDATRLKQLNGFLSAFQGR